MTFLFIGGEDHDFTRIGACSVDTATTAARRTANARCALKVATNTVTDGWQGAFSAASSAFWFTARVYHSVFDNGDTLVFLDGTTRRLLVAPDATGYKYALIKRTAAGANTILATASPNAPSGTLHKYGPSGGVQVYSDGTLLIDYSGDVTTDGATSLSGFVLGSGRGNNASYPTYWSEVIAATVDTRSMALVTLPPAANGATFAWLGSYANLNEVTTDDATLCTSATPGDVAEVTVDSAGITGNPAVLALCVAARAQKGGTGPQNAELVVRTGGSDYFSASQALPAAFERVAAVWETNPATSAPWTYTDLTAAGFNVGIRSLA